MADEPVSKPGLHSPEEIRGFVQRNYPDLGEAKNMSIGLVGSVYRVAVVNHFKVIHTLKIEPKWIDDDKLRTDALKVDANKAARRLTARPKTDPPKPKHKQHR